MLQNIIRTKNHYMESIQVRKLTVKELDSKAKPNEETANQIRIERTDIYCTSWDFFLNLRRQNNMENKPNLVCLLLLATGKWGLPFSSHNGHILEFVRKHKWQYLYYRKDAFNRGSAWKRVNRCAKIRLGIRNDLWHFKNGKHLIQRVPRHRGSAEAL